MCHHSFLVMLHATHCAGTCWLTGSITARVCVHLYKTGLSRVVTYANISLVFALFLHFKLLAHAMITPYSRQLSPHQPFVLASCLPIHKQKLYSQHGCSSDLSCKEMHKSHTQQVIHCTCIYGVQRGRRRILKCIGVEYASPCKHQAESGFLIMMLCP